MSDQKHPFDLAAEQLEAAADGPVASADASRDYWELALAADESVGDYPQAISPEEEDWDDEAELDAAGLDEAGFDESDGIGADGFPELTDGLPPLDLQATANWTDVLSSTLWSEGYLLNERARVPFVSAELGHAREFPAVVRDASGASRSYTYLYVSNQVSPNTIDFARSEFYVTDILGMPIAPIAIDSFDDWIAKFEKVNAGEWEGAEEFSGLEYKKLYFRDGEAPQVDLFQFERISVRVYVSKRLRDAILKAEITGLEIKENRRLFAS